MEERKGRRGKKERQRGGGTNGEREHGERKKEEFSLLSGKLHRMMKVAHSKPTVYPRGYIYTVFNARQAKSVRLYYLLAQRSLRKLFTFFKPNL